MESLNQFLRRDPDYAVIANMRKKNAIPAWDSPHPHGFRVLSGKGATLFGEVPDAEGKIQVVHVDDAHGQIVCNGFGYGNEEIEEARRLVREKRGLDVVSANMTSDVIEWARAVIAETYGPDYAIIFVGTGGEANDLACRVGFAKGGGQAELIGLVNGYGGCTALQNALIGQPGWKGPSTLNIPTHHVGADIGQLTTLLKVLPRGRLTILRKESRRNGVGGFELIPDEFTRLARDGMVDFVIEDEVQSGMGRTGLGLWAFQKVYEGMKGQPDCVVMAKSLGATHRAAAVAVRREHLDALKGSLTYHTFAGMEEDAAAMGTAIQIVQRDNLVENARARGEQFQSELTGKLPSVNFEVSLDGEGLMQAVVLPTSAKVAAVLKWAPHDGWICGKGGFQGERLRIAPPLNVDEGFIHGLVEKIADTLHRPEVEAAA
jgi:4-aminobutyrate aminotransferase